jgi:hypothetical protein
MNEYEVTIVENGQPRRETVMAASGPLPRETKSRNAATAR